MLLHDPGETVTDTGVPGDLTAPNQGVLVLRLDQQFDPLDGLGLGLGDSTLDTTDQEVGHELLEVLLFLFLRHD